MTALVTRRLVVVDPELRVLFTEDTRNLFHRCERLSLVEIEIGNAPVIPVGLEMHDIARQQDVARLQQANE